MGKFASGKESYAISDRSGFRYPYKVMKKEWMCFILGAGQSLCYVRTHLSWPPSLPHLS